MKKVSFAILTAGVALFASCGGADNAAAEKAKADSLEQVRIADSTAKANEEAAAAAAATTNDTTKTDTAKATTAPAAGAH